MNGRPSFQLYYANLPHQVVEKLNREDPDYLSRVAYDEYLEYLVREASWQPLEWHEDQMTVEKRVRTDRGRDELLGREYTSQRDMLRLRIPLGPHPQLDDYLRFTPSTFRLSGEPKWKHETERQSGVECLVFDVEATEGAVNSLLDDIRFWLGNRNRDIEAGNARLKSVIEPIWQEKRKQLEQRAISTDSLLQKLNIPLYQNPDAKAQPVEIKPRELRTVIQKPAAGATKAEAGLKREDVIKLVGFIDQYTKEFEVAPKTYSKMDEEELRDLLVGMMNANYPGSTTAETFSKLGKTDISLHVDSGHVLICECKFWSGASAYVEAIGQLFGYLTWRHNYGVLLHFCRLKDMTRAVSEAQRAASGHPSFAQASLDSQAETRFSTRHAHPQDPGKLVEIHHLFVDLSV